MNDELKLQALTGQPVTVNLGGKSLQAKRATLKDLGEMNRYRAKKMDEGDTGNIDLDVAIYGMYLVLKPYNLDLTPETLAELIPVEDYLSLTEALKQVGFKKPQSPEAEASPTGA